MQVQVLFVDGGREVLLDCKSSSDLLQGRLASAASAFRDTRLLICGQGYNNLVLLQLVSFLKSTAPHRIASTVVPFRVLDRFTSEHDSHPLVLARLASLSIKDPLAERLCRSTPNMAHGNGTALSTGNGHSRAPQKKAIESTETQEKRPQLSTRTDYTRWRMLDEKGRQTWHYLEDDEDAKEWPQTTADKWYLGLPVVRDSPWAVTPILTGHRAFPIYLLSRRLSTRSRMASNSSLNSNFLQETGVANTADPCSYSLVSLSAGMSQRRQSRIILQRR